MIEEKKDNELDEWIYQAMQIHLPRWSQLPELDLYMDQVITYVEKYLGIFFVNNNEKMLTKSMVNNYVKLNLIPQPVKKKYSKRHVAYLIAITILKQIVTIKEVKDGIQNQAYYQGEKHAYNYFVEEMERAVFSVCKQIDPSIEFDCCEVQVEKYEIALKMATKAVACKIVTEKIIQIQLKTNDHN